MNKKNIISFILGLICAGLLWEYYLKPKYQIKSGDAQALEDIRQADIQALNEATAEIDGEVLFKDYGDDDIDMPESSLAGIADKDDDFDFHSKANKELDFYEQAARQPNKGLGVIVAGEDPVVYPEEISVPKVEPQAVQEGSDRISMISAPVKFTLINNNKDYLAYQQENDGDYPKVDFKKNRIVFVESDSALSHGFFETKDYTETPENITVNYKVNILGASKRPLQAPYLLIPSGDKPVVIKQVRK